MAKYKVFEYIGTGTLYLVPEADTQELNRIRQRMHEFPGRMEQVGIYESDLPLAYQWWNVSKKPVSLPKARHRNADFL